MIPGWEEETKGDYLKLLQELGKATPRDFSARMGVSECCVVYWLTELARQGRIRITGVEGLQEGEVPCATESFLGCQRKATCPAGPFPSVAALS
jgi:hypothetical protein